MIEHLFAMKMMVASITVLFFTILICTFAVLIETESFEAMICALEGRSIRQCHSEFIKKVESLPGLRVKEFNLSERNDIIHFETRIEVNSIFKTYFVRNETLEIK